MYNEDKNLILDFGDVMQLPKNMNEIMEAMQAKLSYIKVEASAGADYVKMVGGLSSHVVPHAKSLTLSAELLAEEPQIIEELVLSAINDFLYKLEQARREQVTSLDIGNMFSGEQKASSDD